MSADDSSPSHAMSADKRAEIRAQVTETEARRPTTGELLRADETPWCYLVEPKGRTPRLVEVGSGGGSLSGVVYSAAPDSWARVGWREAQPHVPAEIDAELRREDMIDRLALFAAEVPEGEGRNANRLIDAARKAASPWTQTDMTIDGHDRPAVTASVYNDQIAYAVVATRTMFVQTRGWDGPIELRTGIDRPDLSAWVKR